MKKSDLHGLRIFQCCNTSSQPGWTKQFESESDSDSQVSLHAVVITYLVNGWRLIQDWGEDRPTEERNPQL